MDKKLLCLPLKDSIFQSIIDALPVLFFWTDKNHVILGNNLKHARYYGASSTDEVVGMSMREWGKSLELEDTLIDQFYQEHNEIIATGKGKVIEYSKVPSPTGEAKPILAHKEPLIDENGQVIGVTGIGIDITNFKKAKSKTEVASQSEFIANMGHDLRTPMSGVSGMLDGMMFAVEDAESALQSSAASAPQCENILRDLIAKTREYATVAKDSANELVTFFNEILEVVQLDAGKGHAQVESFDMRALLQRNINLLKPVAIDKKLKLSLAVADDVPQYLHGMSHYLDRTLTNLMSNALKFTKEGGVKVSVDLGDGQRDADETKDTVCVRICVSDTGIGIPKDKFDEIFEHFSRLTSSYHGVYKGAGLGLHAVKQYVEAMDGEIKVDSEVGKGSQFIVTVPFKVADHSDQAPEETTAAEVEPKVAKPSKEPEAKAQAITQEDDTGATRAHVLLVEDGISAAMAAKLFLQRCHCTVDIAQDGAQALTKASENAYDLILMDEACKCSAAR